MLVMKVVVEDIVEVEADAIVNAANAELWMGSGVAGAIKTRGGVEIETQAMRQGPISRGQAVVTGAGRLMNCRYVIHAAAMGGPQWNPSAESIYASTLSALKKAAELGLKSVAFPALGTGVGGFGVEAAAAQMGAAVGDFQRANPETSLKTVIFVLRDAATMDEFRRGLPADAAV